MECFAALVQGDLTHQLLQHGARKWPVVLQRRRESHDVLTDATLGYKELPLAPEQRVFLAREVLEPAGPRNPPIDLHQELHANRVIDAACKKILNQRSAAFRRRTLTHGEDPAAGDHQRELKLA
jgi:hypothetical protein